MSILAHVPEATEADELLAALLEYCETTGIEPYGEQLDAFDAIAEDKHVVLNTPTGSGKSLVALGAHFVAHCRGQRSIYTAPIKALVNEKFFDLCRAFGPERVGLMTGDATVNREAPIICCTAEILAKMALGEGATTPYRWVVMDEFHFYSDPQRGMAWLIPLIEMTDSRFLLMSATLREPQAIADDVERRTGHEAVVVTSDTRPEPRSHDADLGRARSRGRASRSRLRVGRGACEPARAGRLLAGSMRESLRAERSPARGSGHRPR